MTTIDYAARSVAPVRPAFFDALRAVFNAPALFLKRQVVAAQTRNALSRLSDQQLDDIGLCRAQIEGIATDIAARTTL